MADPPCQRFPAAHRLRGSRQFAAVFDHRLRKHAGPLAVCGRPNGLPYSRLGLSVNRRVGNAVARNRIKRLLRESFRLSRDKLPRGMDLVVVVRPHAPLTLEAYREMLIRGVEAVVREQRRRDERQGGEHRPRHAEETGHATD